MFDSLRYVAETQTVGGDLSSYYFTQGVLGVTVVALAIVVIFLYNKLEKASERERLVSDERRREDKQTIKEVTEVLRDNSQNMALMASKIQIGKNERGSIE